MEQRKSTKDAALKDAQIRLREEECALGMEQRLNINDAILKGAKVWLKMEECALSMGQNTHDAAVMGAKT
jgi:hypothetical protein